MQTVLASSFRDSFRDRPRGTLFACEDDYAYANKFPRDSPYFSLMAKYGGGKHAFDEYKREFELTSLFNAYSTVFKQNPHLVRKADSLVDPVTDGIELEGACNDFYDVALYREVRNARARKGGSERKKPTTDADNSSFVAEMFFVQMLYLGEGERLYREWRNRGISDFVIYAHEYRPLFANHYAKLFNGNNSGTFRVWRGVCKPMFETIVTETLNATDNIAHKIACYKFFHEYCTTLVRNSPFKHERRTTTCFHLVLQHALKTLSYKKVQRLFSRWMHGELPHAQNITLSLKFRVFSDRMKAKVSKFDRRGRPSRHLVPGASIYAVPDSTEHVLCPRSRIITVGTAGRSVAEEVRELAHRIDGPTEHDKEVAHSARVAQSPVLQRIELHVANRPTEHTEKNTFVQLERRRAKCRQFLLTLIDDERVLEWDESPVLHDERVAIEMLYRVLPVDAEAVYRSLRRVFSEDDAKQLVCTECDDDDERGEKTFFRQKKYNRKFVADLFYFFVPYLQKDGSEKRDAERNT